MKKINLRPTRAQRAYLLAKLDGEEYKTTPWARARVVRGCVDKGLIDWEARASEAGVRFSTVVVTALGRKAVGR